MRLPAQKKSQSGVNDSSCAFGGKWMSDKVVDPFRLDRVL